jgi:hypothetical protein
MHEYYENYFDLYWDLHLGVTGDAVAFGKGPATLIDDNITFTRAQRATPDR